MTEFKYIKEEIKKDAKEKAKENFNRCLTYYINDQEKRVPFDILNSLQQIWCEYYKNKKDVLEKEMEIEFYRKLKK